MTTQNDIFFCAKVATGLCLFSSIHFSNSITKPPKDETNVLPGLLILDEPTNHLDMNVLSWLEDYLKSYQGALLIVSHDRYFLDRVVNDVYDLDNKTLTHYTGNYTQFVKHKQERLQAEWKHYDQQQKKIAKLEDFVNRNIVRASTTKRAQARATACSPW